MAQTAAATAFTPADQRRIKRVKAMDERERDG
jgi:hypothetical protein